MSINNREDANKYYQMINELVDDYIDKWKIRPSSLKKYLQPGSERFNRFLERNKLKDVKGSEVILKDIIEFEKSISIIVREFPNIPKKYERDILISELIKEVRKESM